MREAVCGQVVVVLAVVMVFDWILVIVAGSTETIQTKQQVNFS